MQFTKEEFEVILEALEALPSVPALREFNSLSFMAMLAPSKESFSRVMDEKSKEFEQKKAEHLAKEIICKQIILRLMGNKEAIIVEE